MNKMLTRFDDEGRYTSVCSYMPESLAYENASRIWLGAADINSQYHDLQANMPKDMPPKPGEDYRFDYSTKTWVPLVERAWERVRATRDQLLSQTDWYVTKANELGEPVPVAVSTYRQALRDITLQEDPFNIVWPTLSQVT